MGEDITDYNVGWRRSDGTSQGERSESSAGAGEAGCNSSNGGP